MCIRDRIDIFFEKICPSGGGSCPLCPLGMPLQIDGHFEYWKLPIFIPYFTSWLTKSNSRLTTRDFCAILFYLRYQIIPGNRLFIIKVFNLCIVANKVLKCLQPKILRYPQNRIVFCFESGARAKFGLLAKNRSKWKRGSRPPQKALKTTLPSKSRWSGKNEGQVVIKKEVYWY